MINYFLGKENESVICVSFNIKNGRFYIGQTINFSRKHNLSGKRTSLLGWKYNRLTLESRAHHG